MEAVPRGIAPAARVDVAALTDTLDNLKKNNIINIIIRIRIYMYLHDFFL
jgi:hypothetical protein